MLAIFTASLGSLQNGLQLLRQHHVAFDLQLATHEGLHSIQLAFGHGHQVCICHGDGAILGTSSKQQVKTSQTSGSSSTHLKLPWMPAADVKKILESNLLRMHSLALKTVIIANRSLGNVNFTNVQL